MSLSSSTTSPPSPLGSWRPTHLPAHTLPSAVESAQLARSNPLYHPHALIGERVVSEGARYEVRDPANEALIAEVSSCGAQEVSEAVEAAVEAQSAWARELPKTRARLLRAWFELIEAHRAPLAELITLESGKPLAEALGEVSYGASFVEWFAEEARRAYGELIPSFGRGRRLITTKAPVGVVAAITPWNFPLAMITRKCAPALAAGCAVVLKPAEGTPLSALALAQLARQAGLPAGLLSVVTCERERAEEVGAALCDHPSVRKVTFTGSTAVGKWLMARSSERLHRLSLELGGNAPLLVFDDADLAKVTRGVMASKFRNSGQTCICTNRGLVHEARFEEVSEALKAEVSALKVGHGLVKGVQVGPLISERSRERIEAQVRAALEGGAELVCGGRALPELGARFFEPTLITRPDVSCALCTEELFAPVLTLTPFSSEREALRLANNTRAGLAAYAFTESHARAWRVAEALEYGMVALNDGALSSEVAPFGGVKESGLGREGGREGLEEFLEVKYLMFGGLEGV